ncbi:MAG: hypothetical protein BroJett011_36790 [Chloroflexota bacterium]|nr:MAG: hypothetical protein BroJett011_36790 [Chloroflexota bacterium]
MRHELPYTTTSNKKVARSHALSPFGDARRGAACTRRGEVAGMYYPCLEPTKWPVEAKAPCGLSTVYHLLFSEELNG